MKPDLSFLKDLSKEAGAILKDGYGKKHNVEYKGPIDLVTEVDKESEKLIVDRILTNFPAHSVVAEEGGLTEGLKDHSWYIDPVDGTSNYAKGLPYFCVSIAYAFEGKMQLAAAYDPLRDECFAAERGKGASLNGEPIHVTDEERLINCMLVTGFPYDMDQPDNNLDHFVSLSHTVHSIRRLGSAVLDQVYVASGRLDGYWEVGLCPWDIAAGTLIVEEAGGIVTNMKGERDYMKPPYDVVMANPGLHEKFLRELHKK